jgi:hypothetical protein
MEKRYCAGGCGEEIPADGKLSHKWGHKNGCKRLPPPSTGLAKREKPLVIDAQVEADETEYVDCQISVPQLDTIYSLLQPHSKAVAVLTGLDSEAE